MAKYLFGNTGTAVPESGAAGDNPKFKRRTKASVPKMNFHVYAVPRVVTGTVAGPATIGNWRYLGGFTDITGLSATTEIVEVADSDTNGLVIKAAGKTTYGDITLNRGYDNDGFMQGWHEQQQGLRNKSDRYMLDLVVFKLTQDPTKIFRCFLITNVWINQYNAGDMDTTTIDPWVEGITLATDGWTYGFPSTDSHAAGVPVTSTVITPVTGGGRDYTLSDDFIGGFSVTGDNYTPITPVDFFLYGDAYNAT